MNRAQRTEEFRRTLELYAKALRSKDVINNRVRKAYKTGEYDNRELVKMRREMIARYCK